MALQGCKEEELVFPPQPEQEVVVGERRPTARPTSLTYVAAFNQNMEIYFPKLSDRVTKAIITYTDGTEKKREITKFDDPVIIHLSEYKFYDFAIQYFTSEGTSSKVTATKLKPLPYEVDYKLSGLQTEQVEGGVKFTFPKSLNRLLKYAIAYKVDGKDMVKTAEGGEVESIVIDKLYDETKPILFHIAIVDDELKLAAKIEREVTPGALPYKAVIPTFLYNMTSPTEAAVSWTNAGAEPIKVKIEYTQNGLNKSAEVVDHVANSGHIAFATDGKPLEINVTVTGKEGVSTSFKGMLEPKEFTDKPSWKATVSDAQDGDGAGAAGLIDNSIDTYWHSQWGPAIPFPHWFNIDFGKERLLSKIGMIRAKGRSNGFVQYNLETSLDGTNYTTVATGLSFDPTNSNWQDYILPNTVKARYVRVTMTKPKNAADAFTHLGEFRAFGY